MKYSNFKYKVTLFDFFNIFINFKFISIKFKIKIEIFLLLFI